jgi:phospholipid/cholesterol/gamma-HCH transport system ATP-binding protein
VFFSANDRDPERSPRGVNKRFGAKKVLDGVDLEIAPGESSLVVIGGSGTGKSVTASNASSA